MAKAFELSIDLASELQAAAHIEHNSELARLHANQSHWDGRDAFGNL